MFGWEFPPVVSGGLGMACQSYANTLVEKGSTVLFVLPRKQEVHGGATFYFANVDETGTSHGVYLPSGSYLRDGDSWHTDRTREIEQYAAYAKYIAQREDFDVIHAHDWKSYIAGIAAHNVSGKPVVLHVHATSLDQSGGQGKDPLVHRVEEQAFSKANAIAAVSNYTKHALVKEYDVDPSKIEVIYNGTDHVVDRPLPEALTHLKKEGKKIVMYHGRITIQKGVDYFVRIAARVLEYEPHTIFIISGEGDMQGQIIHLTHQLGIEKNVMFTGRSVWGDERDQLYQAADLVVMPSVSEPFGLVPLEAVVHGTAALISKQSGVSEILKHALRVDFWDVDEAVNQVVAALRNEPLRKQLVKEGRKEVHHITWGRATDLVLSVYKRLMFR